MNKEVVAKAMDDLADDWHWVLLENATAVDARRWYAERVRTRCGIIIADRPRVVWLMDMGAPEEPTCPRCLAGTDHGLIAAIEQHLRTPEAVPA